MVSMTATETTASAVLQRAAKDLLPGDTFIHVHLEEEHVLVAVEPARLVDSRIGTKWARIMATTDGRKGFVEYGAEHTVELISSEAAL